MIEGESYRSRQKPTLNKKSKTRPTKKSQTIISQVTRSTEPGGGILMKIRGPLLVKTDTRAEALSGEGETGLELGA